MPGRRLQKLVPPSAGTVRWSGGSWLSHYPQAGSTRTAWDRQPEPAPAPRPSCTRNATSMRRCGTLAWLSAASSIPSPSRCACSAKSRRGSNQGNTQNEKSLSHQSSIDLRRYLEMALFEPRPHQVHEYAFPRHSISSFVLPSTVSQRMAIGANRRRVNATICGTPGWVR